MMVMCTCGEWHDVSPTALLVVVQAFVDGDMQRVTKKGVLPACMAEAFTDDRVKAFTAKYRQNKIEFVKDLKEKVA